MANSPNEILLKIQRMINAWETLASAKTFGGMTLIQFKAVAAPSLAARTQIDDLQNQLTQAINARDDADKAFLAKAQQVVNGVLADPDEGLESSLYEAMGYTRKSERKSGLTRKKAKTPPTA